MGVCRNCGHENRKNDKECSKCGAKLNVISLQEWRETRQIKKNTAGTGKRGLRPGPNSIEAKITAHLLTSAKKASFLSRSIATIVDMVLVVVPAVALNFILPILGIVLIVAAYNISFTAIRGQTPGKMVMGIKVISTDGLPMTMEKASIRFLGYLLSWLTLGIGFLISIADRNNQCFHDKFADTYVVEVEIPTSVLPNNPEEKGK